jgi:small nuclear ribonucleoprotein (snRNP)-like protein
MADAPGTAPSSSSKTPADFLNSIKGKPVIVKLNSGVDYKGKNGMYEVVGLMWQPITCRQLLLTILERRSQFAGMLACLDGYMNIAMEQTEVCLLKYVCSRN